MDATHVLISAGTVLLSVAALLGFVQERYRGQPESFTAWRVVHAGGTAGAVQLLALAAVWDKVAGAGIASMVLACTLAAVAWAFFVGPLARALGRPRLAHLVNAVGASLAIPGYLALAFVVL